MMKRRGIVWTLAGLAATSPIAARSQSAAKLHRVGLLIPAVGQWSRAESDAFRDALGTLGHKPGINLAFELRDAEGRLERLPPLAADLVKANVDVIVAITTPAVRAAIDATKRIPIVMGSVGDPVSTGLVPNLHRPGGNVTGTSVQSGELTAKRLQLVKEVVPAARRIAILLNPDDPIVEPQIRDMTATAAGLGVETRLLPVRVPADMAPAFATMTDWRADAILRLAGQSQLVTQPTIELALRHRLPTMLVLKSDVRAGALMSYDADRVDAARRAAQYVDKILKGADSGGLPVEQPTKFELVVNLKTAAKLGLKVPVAVLARADEVVE